MANDGFRKGFLLNNSSKKGKKKNPPNRKRQESIRDEEVREVTTSSALLELEDDDKDIQGSFPFVITQQQVSDEKESHKITFEDTNEHNDDIGLVEVSSRPRNLAGLNNGRVGNNGTDFIEVSPSTTRKSPPVVEVMRESSSDNHHHHMIRVVEEGEEQALNKRSQPHLKNETHDQSSMDRIQWTNTVPKRPPLVEDVKEEEEEDDDDNDEMKAVNFNVLSHELARTAWRLKRLRSKHGETRLQVCKQFIMHHALSNDAKKFLWDSLLPQCVDDSDDPASLLLIGSELMEAPNGVELLAPFLCLDENSDKHSRMMALGAANTILYSLKQKKDLLRLMTMKSLLSLIFPNLIAIVGSSTEKRTVLADNAVKAAVAILAAASKNRERNDSSTRKQLDLPLWESVRSLEQLVQVKAKWIHGSKPGKANALKLAVLGDWSKILRQSERYMTGLLAKGMDVVEARRTTLSHLTNHFTGSHFDSTHNFSLGSLTHTFLSHQERSKVTPIELLSYLDAGCELVQQIRADPNDETHTTRLRGLLRGCLAVCAQSKVLQRFFASSSPNQDHSRIEAATINLLRCPLDEAVDLAVEFINFLWKSSSCASIDLSPQSGNVSNTFNCLLEELSKVELGDDNELDSSSKAIVGLLSRYIIGGGELYLQHLLMHHPSKEETVEVLLAVLALEATENDRQANEKVLEEITLYLIDSLGSGSSNNNSGRIRRALAHTPHLFASVPFSTSVPKLVEILYRSLEENPAKDTVVSVSFALEGCLDAVREDALDTFVRIVVDAVMNIEVLHGSNDEISKICQTFAGKWRRSLLEKGSVSDTKYATLVGRTAQEMMRTSHRSSGLVLYGCLMPSELPSNRIGEKRLINAVRHVLQSCTASLAETVSSRGNMGVFERLAPLLLLRRTPSFMFRIFVKAMDDGNGNSHRAVLGDLSTVLARRLGVDAWKPSVAPEERRLLAEIAGHVLPYSWPLSCSCFHRICFPAFSTLAKSATSNRGSIQTTKLAMFASCHYLAVADGKADGSGVLATSAFALWLTFQTCPSELEEDLVQLQTGCIEFLAGCLEATITTRLDGHCSSVRTPVLEVTADETRTHNADLENHGCAVYTVKRSLCNILETRRWDHEWISNALRTLGLKVSTAVTAAPTLICIWNAFLVVSQRVDGADRLESWAQAIAPWVISCGCKQVSEQEQQPLCMAAALQTLFVILTRTKSLNCLTTPGSTRSQAVQRTFHWGLRCMKIVDGQADEISKMKLAAIKLILSLVSIDEVHGDVGVQILGLGEKLEAIRTISAFANIDPNAEVRRLSGYLLSSLQS